MKYTKYIASFLLAFGLLVPQAYAAEFMSASPDGDGSITVSGETHKNLYTAGGDVTVSAPVMGDLYAAGGNVLITGDVEQDLNVAGGNVTINGKVGGDLRVGGGQVMINGAVGGDVLIGAGQVSFAPTASVAGDLIVGGGRVKLDAPVVGFVKMGGGDITINSTIGGKVWIQSDRSLQFGPKAVVPGEIIYKGREAAKVQDGAKVSEVKFEQIQTKSMEGAKAFIGGAFLIKLLAWLLAAWLLVHFLPNRTRSVIEGVSNNPWMNLAIGFTGIIIIPLAVIVILFTFIGYYTALILLAWFVLAMLVTSLLTAILTGSYVDKWLMKRTALHIDWQTIIIGVVILTLLGFVPVFGWIVCGLLMLMTFGSLLRFVRHEIATNK
jgi:hypothetical protein